MGILDRFFRPPTEAEFATLLCKAFQSAGDPRTYVYEAAQRRVVGTCEGEDTTTFNLVNLYATFLDVPKSQRAEWLKQTTIGFLVAGKELPESFEDVKSDLLPMVRSRVMPELARLTQEMSNGGKERNVSVALTEELAVCLVYDLPTSMRFLNDADLANWGVNVYEALEVARRNLDERPVDMYASIGDSVYIFQAGDAYDATRMLSLELIRKLKVRGAPVALPITRDYLLVTGADDADGLRIVADLAEQECSSPRSVCAVLHVLVGDEWQAWEVPEDHPSAEKLRLLRLRFRHGEYEEQRSVLNEWTQDQGIDAFVAGFMVFENRDRGLVKSFSQLSKGVSTWLPQADRIVFFDPQTDSKHYADWNRAVELLGDRMTRLEHWPPRWAIDGFPTNEQLAALSTDPW